MRRLQLPPCQKSDDSLCAYQSNKMSLFFDYMDYLASPHIYWTDMSSIDVVGHPHRLR